MYKKKNAEKTHTIHIPEKSVTWNQTKLNIHLNHSMILMRRFNAINARCLIIAIEAVHFAIVSWLFGVDFAQREEWGGQ